MIIIAPSLNLPVSDPAPNVVSALSPLPATTPAPPARPSARPATLPLQAGQTLSASVVRGGDAGGSVLLDVGGKPLEARTTLSLAAGQQLNLSVQRTGAETVLQIVDRAASTRATVNEGLRVALPRAAPLLPLLETLAQVTGARPTATTATRLPATVQSAAQAVLATLPERQSLGAADGLRRAVQESGHFLESRAARQPPGSALPATDLKAALVRLAAVIREQLPAPQRGAPTTAATTAAGPAESATRALLPELALLGKASEGAVYRIQGQQLQQVSARAEQPGLLALELPVRGEQQFELLRLRVSEDESRATGDARASVWQVVVDVDLGEAGALQAHVTLRGGGVSATLRVENADTALTTRARLDELGARLEQAGLQVGSLACLNAAPLPGTGNAPDAGPLLEVEA